MPEEYHRPRAASTGKQHVRLSFGAYSGKWLFDGRKGFHDPAVKENPVRPLEEEADGGKRWMKRSARPSVRSDWTRQVGRSHIPNRQLASNTTRTPQTQEGNRRGSGRSNSLWQLGQKFGPEEFLLCTTNAAQCGHGQCITRL
jgi:hypothetical protein